jgi:hypothetical protein
MFLYSDPRAQLDLYHQRARELAKQAADYRLAHESSPDRRSGRRRFGRWPRGERACDPGPAPVLP